MNVKLLKVDRRMWTVEMLPLAAQQAACALRESLIPAKQPALIWHGGCRAFQHPAGLRIIYGLGALLHVLPLSGCSHVLGVCRGHTACTTHLSDHSQLLGVSLQAISCGDRGRQHGWQPRLRSFRAGRVQQLHPAAWLQAMEPTGRGSHSSRCVLQHLHVHDFCLEGGRRGSRHCDSATPGTCVTQTTEGSLSRL